MEDGEDCAGLETVMTRPEDGEAVEEEEAVVYQDARRGPVIQKEMPDPVF